MHRNLLLNLGALAALHAINNDTGATSELAINDSLLPRFTAAGVLVEPGGTFPASDLKAEDFIAKSTPVGNLTDEQLLALVATRGLTVAEAADAAGGPPDRDGDGKPGGSLSKAEIAAALLDLNVEFDAAAKRDDLARLLDAKLAEPKA